MTQPNALPRMRENNNQLISGVQIIDRTIRWFSPLFIILIISVVFRAVRHGGMALSLVQSFFLAVIWINSFLTHRIRPETRLYIYIFALSFNGIMGMDWWGLLGTSQISIILAFLIASMLGFRRWLAIMALDMLLVAMVAVFWVTGDRPLPFDPVALMHSPSAWCMMIAALGSIATASLVWGNINIRLLKTVKQLVESEKKYRGILNATSDALFIHDDTGRIVDVNGAACSLFGVDETTVSGYSINALSLGEYPYSAVEAKQKMDCAIHEGPQIFEWRSRKTDGTLFWSEVALKASTIEGIPRVIASVRDITERKEAEEEKIKLENSLRQSQKMEAVGRLAGGVAHDFNNMLGVILGFTEMAIEDVEPGQPLYENLQEIRTAAERSANLTRQLLVFARKQIIAPKVVDLNRTVDGMLKILMRLIGENIHLIWSPGDNLWRVKIDPTQVDQILTNLCVNARDAIGNVGNLTIETRNVILDGYYCSHHAGFIPGDFVRLVVSDDGCGMDSHTLANLFEPFFTTKGAAHGSGLGLATLYGIVKQNKGFINVYSEVGMGTSFKIYLPRDTSMATDVPEHRAATLGGQGTETILLVEDETSIMRMAAMMLEQKGYTVLAAPRPTQAIRMARAHNDTIHLLITDVVMPEMNGRELAHNLISHHPGIRVLYMSGYTANVIAHHGVLDEDVHFIEKPFSKHDMLVKVREVLDQSMPE